MTGTPHLCYRRLSFTPPLHSSFLSPYYTLLFTRIYYTTVRLCISRKYYCKTLLQTLYLLYKDITTVVIILNLYYLRLLLLYISLYLFFKDLTTVVLIIQGYHKDYHYCSPYYIQGYFRLLSYFFILITTTLLNLLFTLGLTFIFIFIT